MYNDLLSLLNCFSPLSPSLNFHFLQQYLLAGSDNGSVEMHKLTDPYSVSGLKEEGHGVWSLGTHDNHYGQVSCMSLTHDDQYLLTGGGAGNVFVYKTNFSTSRPASHIAKVLTSTCTYITIIISCTAVCTCTFKRNNFSLQPPLTFF